MSTVALVTGASRGLGASIACALALGGARVAINFRRDADGAARVRNRILRAGGDAQVFRADVTDKAEVDELCGSVRASFGPIDVLVLNATGPQPDRALEHLTWQDCLAQFQYFVKSPLLLTQRVVGDMKERRRGRIICIGSEVVELGAPGASAYVAAKAAQLGLTRSWARELGRYGITVNLVASGWVPTERHLDVPAEPRQAYLRAVPLGRFGTPEDVAAAVAFLASDSAAFISGQKIAVNGANTL